MSEPKPDSAPSLNRHLIAGLAIFFAAIVSDTIWLGYIAKDFYITHLRDIARLDSAGNVDVVYWAAFGVYLCLAVGVVKFVLPQLAAHKSLHSVFLHGAVFGIIMYGFYDFTNHATLKTWPVPLMLLDIAWGAVQGGIVTVLGFKISKY